MKRILLSAIVVLLIITSFAAQPHLVSKTFIQSYTKIQLDSLLNANGVPAAVANDQYDIDIYKVIYNTLNFDSTPIIASGLMVIPNNAHCKLPLSSYQHGTQTEKSQAPSRVAGAEPYVAMVLASNGYVALEPDYLGLGDGPGLHRYQHAATEASATIDLLRTAREICDSMGVKLNGQLFLEGYSEGGHATMATHRKIQTDLSNEFTVTASVPMSGAYDMSGVMVNLMLSDSTYPQPVYLPYLLISWDTIYHLYHQPSDVFRTPYDTLLPPLFDGLHSIGYLNHLLPSVPKRILDSAVTDSFRLNPNHFLRVALHDNDVYDWTPTSPMKILYCKADNFVPYQNAIVAYNKMIQNGCTVCQLVDVDSTQDHNGCAQLALLEAKLFFDQYVHLDSCATSIANTTYSSFDLQLFPNPMQNELTISTFFDRTAQVSISIVALDGREVLHQDINETVGAFNRQLSVARLPSGAYFLHFSRDGETVSRLLVRE